ncbi:MAG TPA: bifunctional ornithine acetyltransferase/N-acetylglutamate synthase [Rhodobacteraceae bacterium]|nr:bifunctional ornithine acetyltransferase/N-acetylglutamate synthase [Paracoccaceae bacterium]
MVKSKAKLKHKISKLKTKIRGLKAELNTRKADTGISPLAPALGFPTLPEINGVTYAAGAAGVKYQERDDVMLARIEAGSAVAGVFTRSATRSGSVLDCQVKLAALQKTNTVADALGVVVNSGNSNAFTGKAGDTSVEFISSSAAKVLKTRPENVLTSSTGVIGELLPHDKIISILDDLNVNLSPTNGAAAARAIMTTDTFAKGAGRSVEIDGKTILISGFAKGSGMIAPDMATMLVYIFTDAAVTSSVLQQIISSENRRTFNAITVDSDTSTSDTLLAFATGAAGNTQIIGVDGVDSQKFASALHDVMRDLAHLVVKDGEGATKFIEVEVTGAVSDDSAHTVALAIANSPLVKTAAAGEDPNWGRVVMAIGKSGEPADRDKISINFGNILVAEKGWVSPSYTEDAGSTYMKNRNLKISVGLGMGDGTAQVWTCDLTHGYIKINADYRS